jgi:hypothetical protein
LVHRAARFPATEQIRLGPAFKMLTGVHTARKFNHGRTSRSGSQEKK